MDTTTRQDAALTTPDGVGAPLRLSKRGAAFTIEELQGYVFEGKAFTAIVGALSTPIVGGGNGTVIDIDQPEVGIGVPSGKYILPFSVKVQAQTPLLATDADEAEILLAVDKASTLPSDGTATTTITPVNMKTDSANVSACTVKSAYTADLTDPVLGIELDRAVKTGDVNGTPGNALWEELVLNYQPRVIPILVGGSALYIYWGGTVQINAFAQICWVELDS